MFLKVCLHILYSRSLCGFGSFLIFLIYLVSLGWPTFPVCQGQPHLRVLSRLMTTRSPSSEKWVVQSLPGGPPTSLQLLTLTPSACAAGAQSTPQLLNRVSVFLPNSLLPKTTDHFAKRLRFVEDVLLNTNYSRSAQVALAGKSAVFSKGGGPFPKPLWSEACLPPPWPLRCRASIRCHQREEARGRRAAQRPRLAAPLEDGLLSPSFLLPRSSLSFPSLPFPFLFFLSYFHCTFLLSFPPPPPSASVRGGCLMVRFIPPLLIMQIISLMKSRKYRRANRKQFHIQGQQSLTVLCLFPSTWWGQRTNVQSGQESGPSGPLTPYVT